MKQPSASLNGCVVCPQTLCLQLAENARDKLTAENLKKARTHVGCPPLGKHKLLVGKKNTFVNILWMSELFQFSSLNTNECLVRSENFGVVSACIAKRETRQRSH